MEAAAQLKLSLMQQSLQVISKSMPPHMEQIGSILLHAHNNQKKNELSQCIANNWQNLILTGRLDPPR